MSKELLAIFEYLEKEKGIKKEIIIHAIEESLAAAAQKSVEGASNVTVKIDPKTFNINVFCEKEIVDEVEVPAQEISLKEARELDPDCQMGQFIDVLVTPKNFGRIAAQKARQVINQKLRNAEKDVIYEEYRDRIHELVSGTVKRFVRGNKMIVDLGKVEAVMPLRNYPKTEFYNVGDKIYALLLEVAETEGGGAEVILTRSHPEFIEQLFIQEVPEISDGTVVIDRIVREAGYRTKIAVSSTDTKVDPVGACVGMRGMRVKNILRELNNEKVDIIPFSTDPIELLQSALNPIEIRKISVNEDDRQISIVVDDDDYPMVLGKRGRNASLNGELIGYTLEIQKMTDYNRQLTVQRLELAESEDPWFNTPLEGIPGLNKLIFEQLKAENLITPRAILQSSPERLAEIPGISTLEKAQEIIELIVKERT